MSSKSKPVTVGSVSENETSQKTHANQMYLSLLATYPDAHCELDYKTPFQLLVATILSAQTTDKRVNQVTKELFAVFPTPADLGAAPILQVEQIIRPLGMYRNKAKSIVGTAEKICNDFGGAVPNTLQQLVSLPGVGRKTANVVLGNAFDIPGLTPDTHFCRTTRRMGWADAKTPDGVEKQVGQLFDPKVWTKLSHVLIWHGRRCCHARTPNCRKCPVVDLCPTGMDLCGSPKQT